MRVSKEKAAQNRERILASAARLFREHGIDATGVDAITEDAGLTHGGLYSQFGYQGGYRGRGDSFRAGSREARLAARARTQSRDGGASRNRGRLSVARTS